MNYYFSFWTILDKKSIWFLLLLLLFKKQHFEWMAYGQDCDLNLGVSASRKNNLEKKFDDLERHRRTSELQILLFIWQAFVRRRLIHLSIYFNYCPNGSHIKNIMPGFFITFRWEIYSFAFFGVIQWDKVSLVLKKVTTEIVTPDDVCFFCSDVCMYCIFVDNSGQDFLPCQRNVENNKIMRGFSFIFLWIYISYVYIEFLKLFTLT